MNISRPLVPSKGAALEDNEGPQVIRQEEKLYVNVRDLHVVNEVAMQCLENKEQQPKIRASEDGLALIQ